MSKYSLSSAYSLSPKAVKKLLIDLEMTQLELIAKLSDLSRTTVLRYINGQGRNPKIQAAIADALGVPLRHILQKPIVLSTEKREVA